MASWWRHLEPAAREDLLTLAPGEFVPEHLAEDLRGFGVDVAAVAVALKLAGRSYAVYAQPPALRDFLAAARVWREGWCED
ncbi:hypothetical protein GCM10009528_13610 [Kineococcus aurantiacus]